MAGCTTTRTDHVRLLNRTVGIISSHTHMHVEARQQQYWWDVHLLGVVAGGSLVSLIKQLYVSHHLQRTDEGTSKKP